MVLQYEQVGLGPQKPVALRRRPAKREQMRRMKRAHGMATTKRASAHGKYWWRIRRGCISQEAGKGADSSLPLVQVNSDTVQPLLEVAQGSLV